MTGTGIKHVLKQHRGPDNPDGPTVRGARRADRMVPNARALATLLDIAEGRMLSTRSQEDARAMVRLRWIEPANVRGGYRLTPVGVDLVAACALVDAIHTLGVMTARRDRARWAWARAFRLCAHWEEAAAAVRAMAPSTRAALRVVLPGNVEGISDTLFDLVEQEYRELLRPLPTLGLAIAGLLHLVCDDAGDITAPAGTDPPAAS